VIGRDPFEDTKESRDSGTLKNLIKGKPPLAPDPREIEVTVRLTPATLKHIDQVCARLAARGRTISRDELIRIAITLLSPDDVV
jgi:hypothetical protein